MFHPQTLRSGVIGSAFLFLRRRFAAGILLATFAACVSLSVPAAMAADDAQPALQSESQVAGFPAADLSAPAAVITLGSVLSDGRVSDPQEAGGAWFTLTVENRSPRPIARVLVAAESPAAGVAFVPLQTRPVLREVAASDPELVVERATAFGENAFRIVIPAAHRSTLALQFAGASAHPEVLAWTESALIAHNSRSAVLSGMVAGLFTGALAFAAGVAVLGRRPFAKWAAFLAASLLFADLVSARVFDDTWLTAIGGPYALFSLALSLVIASGVRLIDHVAPYEAFRSWARLWADRAAIIIVVLGFASFFGVPGIGLFLRFLAVVGAAGASGYLAHCGRLGVAAARRLAPAATIFALITAVASFRALGLFGINLVAPAAIAGFSSVGAILVAMAAASAAAEPSVARLRAMRQAHGEDDIQEETTDEVLAETREHAAVAAAHQGIFDLDLNSGLLSLSPEGAGILGLPDGITELNANALLQRIHPDDRATYERAIATYRRQAGIAFRLEFRAKGPGGRLGWYELRATMRGKGHNSERCLGLIADITTRKTTDVPPSSRSDALTGVGSRTALSEYLDSAGARLRDVVVAILDLDRFKSVNASLGPDRSDALLKAVAQRLTQGLPRAMIYRIGGDSFVLVLEPGADMKALGQAIVRAMSRPFPVAGRDIYLPVSVGVAAGVGATDGPDLLAQAERAMVAAKRGGGARAQIYSREISSAGQVDPVALEADLRQALERGEILLHYQPIIRLKDGSVAGFEALLRWAHPERGLIEPERFVEHAERTGLIITLGQLALKNAATELKRWQRYFPLTPPLFVSVNVAWRQIADDAFAKELEKLLKKATFPRGTLRLEITESAVMADSAAAESRLTRLKDMGVGLAVDDFGTCHSSLSHLRRFPFTCVKIDKSFLSRSAKDGDAMITSMIGLAHELGLEVVAEGVETKEQAERLAALGCELGQGYLFSAPLPAADVNAFITMRYAK